VVEDFRRDAPKGLKNPALALLLRSVLGDRERGMFVHAESRRWCAIVMPCRDIITPIIMSSNGLCGGEGGDDRSG